MELWEILVPCTFNDTKKSVRKRHHREFDKYVRRLTGGLTLFTPVRGQWVCPYSKELYEERVIPVRIACTEKQIRQIIAFAIRHYRQLAIMAYRLSDKVLIVDSREA